VIAITARTLVRRIKNRIIEAIAVVGFSLIVGRNTSPFAGSGEVTSIAKDGNVNAKNTMMPISVFIYIMGFL
jgi:hypothetical protein